MGAGYLPRLAGFVLMLSFAANGEAKPPRGAAAAGQARPGKAKPAPAPVPAPSEAPGSAAPPPKDAPEKGVQGEKKSAAASPLNAVQTEENKEGVKTYKFGAVEVESRLKSPELIYFMRRVRAEFAAGELGHRSFLPELHSTERLPTFR
jgi:hypothetical protein